ncbi:MAG: hypothetical protein ACFFBH_06760 [Promethearchaeota archaeon]
MKKVKLSLNLGIIDKDEYGKELIIEYLKHMSLNNNAYEKFLEFLIVFQDVPIKIKLFNALNFNDLLDDYKPIKRIDVLIYIIDIYELDSLESSNFTDFEGFSTIYMFQGISILLGLNKHLIENINILDRERISSIDLINKTKNLGFLYCFEIQNKNHDFSELFNKIFENFILKLGNLNPELLKNAISYGKELKNHFNF